MTYNLIGQKFGELTVVGEIKGTHTTPKKWKCLCSCGTETYALTYQLTSGTKKSCGNKIHRPHGNTTRLLGKKFHKLLVTGFSHFEEKSHKDYWICKCDCGNEKECIVQGYNLTSGAVQSCGCLTKEYVQNVWFNDLTGEQYGELTVLDFIGRKDSHSYWRCKCSCGNEVTVTANNLRRGHTMSCGHNLYSHKGTKEEIEIKNYILSLDNTLPIEKAPHILDNKYEIDLYIPSLHFGIEYNGSVYHASIGGAFKDLLPNYHQQKFILAKQQGIRLMTIFDIDWQSKQEKIKLLLKDLICEPTKIYARDCDIQQIPKTISNEFCDMYHLQSHSHLGIINYGLYYQNNIVAVMSFGKLRLKKQIQGNYELHRYCVKAGYKILGGSEKLLSHFEKDYKPSLLLSYSDNDFFNGSVYKRLGFEFDGYTIPSYYWFYGQTELKREQCQVHKLKLQYPEIYQDALEADAKNKEDYIMTKLKASKVYRCGNTRWKKNYSLVKGD